MNSWMKSLFCALTALALVSCTTASIQTPPNTTVFYVSPDGNDEWSGMKASPQGGDGPFASLERARDAIRFMKRNSHQSRSYAVYVREGIYFLKDPLVFTEEDSGTPDQPILYAAYPGEKPVISGGRLIQTPIVKVQEGLVKTTLPSVTRGDWYFYQLFINGERRTRARTPNVGYYQMDGQMTLEGPAHFRFHEGDIKKEWAGRGDVDVIGLAKWAEIRMPIVEVDEEEQTATLTKQVPPSNWRGADHPRYWIENAPEALDWPGEWRLDMQTGLLSVLLKTGDNVENLQIIAPRLETLVRIQGDPANDRFVRSLIFQGLTFCHTTAPKLQEGYPDTQAAYDISAAFTADGAQKCRIEQCRFVQIGNYAAAFAQGCSENQIIGCEMADLGAGGVKIGEPQMRQGALRTYSNQVTDNHIHHTGVIYPAAVGVWVGQSDHNWIAYNHIHHTYYTGLSIGWTWGYRPTGAHHNVIEFNHVHHIGQGVLSDMGGIYTLGTQPGTEIRNNLFHHIDSYSYGGWGIYPDEGSTQILIENNITHHTKSAGFHQHYGKENMIRNNIFAFAKEYQVMRTRAEEHLSFTFE
ncbi:MAG: right-handed parallel beta-helix repeat-containing protein, partial [Candidatus Hinthialibacter sp.]